MTSGRAAKQQTAWLPQLDSAKGSKTGKPFLTPDSGLGTRSLSLTCPTCLTAHHLRRFWKNAPYPSPSDRVQWAVSKQARPSTTRQPNPSRRSGLPGSPTTAVCGVGTACRVSHCPLSTDHCPGSRPGPGFCCKIGRKASRAGLGAASNSMIAVLAQQ